ncbi:MAG: hypothetical protein AB1941_21005 [Gemmatimonadota bacterium]
MNRSIIAAAAAAALWAALPAQAQSPLAAYPGFGHNAAADEARFQQEEVAREQRIAQCMRAQGLQYTPAPSVDATGVRSAAEAKAASESPNERHANSLTPEKRREYYVALYGVPDPYAQSAEALHDPASPTGGGCLGEAVRAIPGVYAAAAALTEEYVAMRLQVLDDPRVNAAEEQWSECMRARGLNFASPRAMRRELATQARENREQGRARLREVDPVARECGRTAGLDAAVAQARNEKEAAFVAQHRATLDRHAERMRNQPTQ